jgi:outer membrane protein assembly factor BamB
MIRRWRRPCSAFVLAVTASTGTLLAQSRSANPVPLDRDLARYGLVRAWWNRATLDPGRDTVKHFTADEDNVYVQATSGVVTAFDAESGVRLWSTLIGPPDTPSLPVATNEDQLLLAVGMQLYSVDKLTGKLLWELKLLHHPSAAPGLDSEQVYLGMVEGSVYCYDLRRIHQLYHEGRLPQWSNLAQLWRYKAPEAITSPPMSNGRIVVFASLSGSLFAISRRDNKLQFQFETEGHAPILAPVGQGSGSLMIPTEDSRLLTVNDENGKRRWVFTSGNPIRRQPAVIGPHVFVAPVGEGLYCLSVASGVIQWHQRRASTFLAATSDAVYASDDLGNVVVLARNDGAVVGALPMGHLSVRVQNERTDRLYLASKDGLVVGLREQGLEFPIYHKYPERRPILPEFAPDDPPAANEPAGG